MGIIIDTILGAPRSDATSLPALAAVGVRPRYKIVGTLAEVLDVTGSYGDDALVTNLGTGGTGTLVRYGSRGWRVPHEQPLAFDLSVTLATASTSEVVVKQALLPAGFSSLMTGLRIECGWTKSSNVVAVTAARVRIGSAGTTADSVHLESATNWATSRALTAAKSYGFVTASSLAKLGSPAPGGADFGFAPTAFVPGAVAINDTLATATYISMTLHLATAAEQPGAYLLKVVGLP